MCPVPPSDSSRKFDGYANDYAALHAKNIAMTGEQPEYFARHKLQCLERLLRDDSDTFSAPILDYGCGVGMVTRQLATRFSDVHGYDPSPESLIQARAEVPGVTFHDTTTALPDSTFALAMLSGVLHHVPPAERAEVLAIVRRKLRPGTGRIVIFEHNPLNPLTRRAVSTCPFDDDAILLWPWEATRLLAAAQFSEVRRDFVVFFPKALSFLRRLEPYLRAVPAGGQMMLVGRRSD